MATYQKRKTNDGKTRIYGRIRMLGTERKAIFDRMTDFREWEQEEERKIRNGLYLDTEESTKHLLSAAIERYINERVTSDVRRVHLRRWKETLGRLPLSAISIVRINDTTAFWHSTGVDPKRNEKGKLVYKRITGATVNRHLNSLSMVFRAAKEWGWISRNAVLEAKHYPDSKGRIRFLSDEERDALLEACKASEYKPLYFLVVLALSTGMRKNEIRYLKWSDVDVKNGAIILLKTKNKHPRRVPVRGLALQLLQEHAKVRRIDSDFLFPGEKPSKAGCTWTPPSNRPFDFKRAWVAAVKKAGLNDFRFHDLRHSCASYLAMNGASLIEIAEALGHRSHDVVKRYAHLTEAHVATVVESMNRKIFG